MPAAISARKNRGRPRVGSTNIGVRLPPEQLEELDAWIRRNEDPPSRPEAIRQLVADALRRKRS